MNVQQSSAFVSLFDAPCHMNYPCQRQQAYSHRGHLFSNVDSQKVRDSAFLTLVRASLVVPGERVRIPQKPDFSCVMKALQSRNF